MRRASSGAWLRWWRKASRRQMAEGIFHLRCSTRWPAMKTRRESSSSRRIRRDRWSERGDGLGWGDVMEARDLDTVRQRLASSRPFLLNAMDKLTGLPPFPQLGGRAISSLPLGGAAMHFAGAEAPPAKGNDDAGTGVSPGAPVNSSPNEAARVASAPSDSSASPPLPSLPTDRPALATTAHDAVRLTQAGAPNDSGRLNVPAESSRGPAMKTAAASRVEVPKLPGFSRGATAAPPIARSPGAIGGTTAPAPGSMDRSGTAPQTKLPALPTTDRPHTSSPGLPSMRQALSGARPTGAASSREIQTAAQRLPTLPSAGRGATPLGAVAMPPTGGALGEPESGLRLDAGDSSQKELLSAVKDLAKAIATMGTKMSQGQPPPPAPEPRQTLRHGITTNLPPVTQSDEWRKLMGRR